MNAMRWWRRLTAREKWVYAWLAVCVGWLAASGIDIARGDRWTVIIIPSLMFVGAVLQMVALHRRLRNRGSDQ